MREDGPVGVLLIVVLVAMAVGGVWYFAVLSRKSYECPSCGERLTVEYMEARHCNVCGAPLGKGG
jgi:hypothetical protein